MSIENDCVEGCIHCAIASWLCERPISFSNICQVGQVVADMIASIEPAETREADGRAIQGEINKMIDAAIANAGAWKGKDRAEQVGHA